MKLEDIHIGDIVEIYSWEELCEIYPQYIIADDHGNECFRIIEKSSTRWYKEEIDDSQGILTIDKLNKIDHEEKRYHDTINCSEAYCLLPIEMVKHILPTDENIHRIVETIDFLQ